MVFLAKHDRFPARRLEARVDALRFGANFVEKILVAFDVRAAGRADLRESEPLLISGVELEKTLEGAEALEDSLGIVNTIYTHSQKGGLDTHLRAEGGAFFAGVARFAERV